MTREQLQTLLKQSYDRTRWLEMMRHVLPGTDVFATPQPIVVPSQTAHQVVQLGRVRLSGGRQLAALEIQVGERIDLVRNRVGLRNFVARFIDQERAHGVLAIFLSPEQDYRFTFAARETTLTDSGELVRTETLPRRYTYLLGPNESCRTAAERFDLLARRGGGATLADVLEAFNVEKLNKEFFADFRKAFDVVVKDILGHNQGWERSAAERETQTLLSRLLFLYFIQRKGWLNRQRDYLIRNFKRVAAGAPDGSSFYDQFLRPFFVKLSDNEAYFPNLDLGDLPFLNGGLFDDEIGSLTERGRMKVGNPALRHVFDCLLEAYNFTVREDTPLDQEVAIDPEMLGKIFESLVLQLEQSDTGGKTSRHDTGSYYTPRPIVHYLCREGLRAWLEQFPPVPVGDDVRSLTSSVEKKSQSLVTSSPTSNGWPARLEKLFALDAADGLDEAGRAQLNELLTPDEARALVDRLDDFRACDPAVGSGAFLVGLLHELVNLRRLCETRSRGKDPAADLEWLYETKKRVIENVLYGVDLQQRAVEICKLRLWISLMVDYPLEVDPDNCALPDFRKALRKITPLPNLDFKIRRANSLIEQIRGHAVKFPQTAADSRDFNLSLNKLATAKHRFYEARRKKEKRLTQLDILEATAELAKYEFSAAKLKYGLLPSDKDADRAAELARAEAEMGKLQLQIAAARKKSERDKDGDIERLSRVFNDEAKPTFVWQLDFAEIFHRSADSHVRENLLPDEERADKAVRAPSGFDLVLANPPYVRQEKIKELKPFLQNAYDCYTGTADLYVYFYARAHELLRAGGVGAFISSNKWLRASYGEKLRQFLLDAQEFRLVVDFGESPVFEAVGTFPGIFLWRKYPRNNSPTTWAVVRDLTACYREGIANHVARTRLVVTAAQFGKGKPRLSAPDTADKRGKMEARGPHLGSFLRDQMFNGVKTGLNDAFVITSLQRDELIEKTPESKRLIKPFLVGDDIRRYEIENRQRYLLYLDWAASLSVYPSIESHLRLFEKELRMRDGVKDAGPCPWFALSRPRPEASTKFAASKILFPDIGKESRFVMDCTGFYPETTGFVIAIEDWFLLAVLNSSTAWFFFKEECTALGDKDEGGRLRLKIQYVQNLPIPDAKPVDRDAVAALAREAQKLHGQRRVRMEKFLRAVGLEPAQSTNRNILEQPWAITPEDFARRAPRPNQSAFTSARDETNDLTERIQKIEREIDSRVATLYGL